MWNLKSITQNIIRCNNLFGFVGSFDAFDGNDPFFALGEVVLGAFFQQSVCKRMNHFPRNTDELLQI